MYSLGDFRSLPDPAQIWRWRAVLPFNGGRVYAESVQATFRKVPAKARFYAGSNNYYPDISDCDGLSLVLYETHNYTISRWKNDWDRRVFDPDTQFYGVPKDYKRDVVVELIGLDNQPVYTITYVGCWPTDRAPLDLTYQDDTGRVTVMMQLSVDTIKPQRGGSANKDTAMGRAIGSPARSIVSNPVNHPNVAIRGGILGEMNTERQALSMFSKAIGRTIRLS